VSGPSLSGRDRRALLDLAVEAIRCRLVNPWCSPLDIELDDTTALARPQASFVTLERDDQLLGCIGSLEPTVPLAQGVARHAVAAAFEDPRLPPVTFEDYPVMSVKISVLSPIEPLDVASRAGLERAVRPGIDGLVLRAGARRSTLLPSVWPKVRDASDFIDILWAKAGLDPAAWPNGATVSRYTTEEFSDPGPRAPIATASV